MFSGISLSVSFNPNIITQLSLTLIFVETKKGADALEYWLAINGFPVIAIHGDKVQMVCFHFLLNLIL